MEAWLSCFEVCGSSCYDLCGGEAAAGGESRAKVAVLEDGTGSVQVRSTHMLVILLVIIGLHSNAAVFIVCCLCWGSRVCWDDWQAPCW
jgi:hypothetical protein